MPPYDEAEAYDRVASHDLRLELLRVLLDGPALTTELGARLGVSRYNLYRHLDVLETEGFIVVERLGRKMKRFHIEPEHEDDVRKMLGMSVRRSGMDTRPAPSVSEEVGGHQMFMGNMMLTHLGGEDSKPSAPETAVEVIRLRGRGGAEKHLVRMLEDSGLLTPEGFEEIDHIIVVGKRRRGG